MAPGPGAQFVEKTVSRLKFPQAFGVFVALFLFDLIIPDFVPFVDEILLGLGAALVLFGHLSRLGLGLALVGLGLALVCLGLAGRCGIGRLACGLSCRLGLGGPFGFGLGLAAALAFDGDIGLDRWRSPAAATPAGPTCGSWPR